MTLTFRQILFSTFRSYLSFFYFAFFHLTRYYLILIFGLGFLLHSLWFFGGLAILYTSIVDYCVKKPDLNYPVFRAAADKEWASFENDMHAMQDDFEAYALTLYKKSTESGRRYLTRYTHSICDQALRKVLELTHTLKTDFYQ